jgi:hypothetical protein
VSSCERCNDRYQRSSNYVVSRNAASMFSAVGHLYSDPFHKETNLVFNEDFREGFPIELVDMDGPVWSRGYFNSAK